MCYFISYQHKVLFHIIRPTQGDMTIISYDHQKVLSHIIPHKVLFHINRPTQGVISYHTIIKRCYFISYQHRVLFHIIRPTRYGVHIIRPTKGVISCHALYNSGAILLTKRNFPVSNLFIGNLQWYLICLVHFQWCTCILVDRKFRNYSGYSKNKYENHVISLLPESKH
jgi:hypothetical protein